MQAERYETESSFEYKKEEMLKSLQGYWERDIWDYRDEVFNEFRPEKRSNQRMRM